MSRIAGLPPGWAIAAVSDVAEYQRGVSYQKTQAVNAPAKGHRPVLRANNLADRFDLDDLVFVEERMINEQQIIRAGDIVFAMSSGSKKHVGKSVLATQDMDCAFGAFCGLLRPRAGVAPKFLAMQFGGRVFRRYIEEAALGTNINNLKSSDLLAYEIAVAPLDEQRRIVAKIEELFSELDKAVESLTTARGQLEVYRQSVLKHAFEGKLTVDWRAANPGEITAAELISEVRAQRAAYTSEQAEMWRSGLITARPRPAKQLPSFTAEDISSFPHLPDSWEWIKIDLLCKHDSHAIKAGPFGSSLKKESYVAHGYKVYGQEQVICGDSESGDYFIDQQKFYELESCKVAPNDILISLVGTVGKVLILPESAKPGIINPRLIKISPNCSAYLPQLFKAYFESSFVKSLYKLKTHGATMDVMNLGLLQELPFPLCSLDEQKEISRRLSDLISGVERNEKEIEEALMRTAALRQSILKQAFSGHLVGQDPTDEPASVLLDRIRAERAQVHSSRQESKKKTKEEAA